MSPSYCIVVHRFLGDDTAAYGKLIGRTDRTGPEKGHVSNVGVTPGVFFFLLVLVINL